MKTANCVACGSSFALPSVRGRPPTKCLNCRADVSPTKVHSSFSSLRLKEPEVPKASPPEPPKTIAEIFKNYVCVSRLGLAFGSNNKAEAERKFSEYCKKSAEGFGQVGFETVQLVVWNSEAWEVEKEFTPEKIEDKS